MNNIHNWINTGLLALVAVLVLVGGNQPVQGENLGGNGTRFPNGISADSTSPNDGEIRGTDLTITDDVAITDDVTISGDATISGVLGYLEKTASTSANSSSTVAMSGTTFYIAGPDGATTTLPAVAAATGTVLRWVIATAIATNDFTIVSPEGDNIEGSMIVAGAVVDCNANDKIKFVVSAENLGDAVELRSDGQKWFVTDSNALTAGALTCDG